MHGRVEVKYLFGAALLVLLSLQRAHADPVGETPRVTTEKTAILRDAERRDQLRVTVWYPAAKGSVEQPLVMGPPDKPLFEVGSVAFDAPFADDGSRPILLLAPGGGASARLVGWFGIAMARAGYVVIAVDHPGDNGDDLKTTAAMLLAWDRAEDLRSALAAAENDPVIGPHLDRARVGAAGVRRLSRLARDPSISIVLSLSAPRIPTMVPVISARARQHRRRPPTGRRLWLRRKSPPRLPVLAKAMPCPKCRRRSSWLRGPFKCSIPQVSQPSASRLASCWAMMT
jgi:hypothetical protein